MGVSEERLGVVLEGLNGESLFIARVRVGIRPARTGCSLGPRPSKCILVVFRPVLPFLTFFRIHTIFFGFVWFFLSFLFFLFEKISILSKFRI
jgi:hypothetical protein